MYEIIIANIIFVFLVAAHFWHNYIFMVFDIFALFWPSYPIHSGSCVTVSLAFSKCVMCICYSNIFNRITFYTLF